MSVRRVILFLLWATVLSVVASPTFGHEGKRAARKLKRASDYSYNTYNYYYDYYYSAYAYVPAGETINVPLMTGGATNRAPVAEGVVLPLPAVHQIPMAEPANVVVGAPVLPIHP